MQLNALAVPVLLATTEEVLRVNVSAVSVFGLEVKNSGANPLDVFQVKGKFSDLGSEITILSAAGDYTTPAYPCVRASGSPVTLAAGATAWMFIDVRGVSELVIYASSSAGATTLDFHGSKKSGV